MKPVGRISTVATAALAVTAAAALMPRDLSAQQWESKILPADHPLVVSVLKTTADAKAAALPVVTKLDLLCRGRGTAYSDGVHISFDAGNYTAYVASSYAPKYVPAIGSLRLIAKVPLGTFNGQSVVERRDGFWLRQLEDGTVLAFIGDAKDVLPPAVLAQVMDAAKAILGKAHAMRGFCATGRTLAANDPEITDLARSVHDFHRQVAPSTRVSGVGLN